MRLYSFYQTIISLGFILLCAHTEAYQIANWPEGRVVYVHPWVVLAAYALGFAALVSTLGVPRNPDLRAILDRWMPRLASLLLFIGVVGMALVAPGPYAP